MRVKFVIFTSPPNFCTYARGDRVDNRNPSPGICLGGMGDDFDFYLIFALVQIALNHPDLAKCPRPQYPRLPKQAHTAGGILQEGDIRFHEIGSRRCRGSSRTAAARSRRSFKSFLQEERG